MGDFALNQNMPRTGNRFGVFCCTNAKVVNLVMPAGAKPGERRGGRAKGTPNKEKKALIERIQALYPGYHPVIAMAQIANDESPEVDLQMRFQAHKEVAQYIEPKRAAMQHTGAGDGPVEFVVRWQK